MKIEVPPESSKFHKSPEELRKEAAAKRKKLHTLWFMLGLYLLFVGVWVLAPTMKPLPKRALSSFFQCPCPLLFAHQGASAYAPSNTIPAFRLALKMKADILETDVHATEDGVIVLSHDATVNRMTNGTGKIREKTWAELQKLDAGYRFTKDGGKTWPYRGKGIKIPGLEQVLKRFPKTRFNLEIKNSNAKWLPELSLLLQKLKAEDRVLIASKSDTILQKWRLLNPRVVTSAGLLEGVRFSLSAWIRPTSTYAAPFHALQFPHTAPGLASLTKVARRSRLGFHVWTVNKVEDMNKALERGANGLMTDRPDVAWKVLQKWRGKPAKKR